jgi:hypothetical protein
VRLKVLGPHVPPTSENASPESPFPRSQLPTAFQDAPAQSRSRAEGAFAPPSCRPPGPHAATEPSAPVVSSTGSVLGARGLSPISALHAYLPVQAMRWLPAPSGLALPFPSGRVPPPLSGWAPSRDRSPPAALQLPSAAWRVRRSAAARLGAEAERGGGERAGRQERRV